MVKNKNNRNEKSEIFFTYQERLSDFIIKLRGKKTQREIADILSEYTPAGNTVKQTSISSYEKKKTLPSLDTFYAIVKHTGIPSDELLNMIFEGINSDRVAQILTSNETNTKVEK